MVIPAIGGPRHRRSHSVAGRQASAFRSASRRHLGHGNRILLAPDSLRTLLGLSRRPAALPPSGTGKRDVGRTVALDGPHRNAPVWGVRRRLWLPHISTPRRPAEPVAAAR